METPDKWEIIKIEANEQTAFRIFSSFYGGYGGSDSWLFSTNIAGIDNCKDYWFITTGSGNTYRLYKDRKGMSGYASNAYQQQCNRATEFGAKMSFVEVKDVVF